MPAELTVNKQNRLEYKKNWMRSERKRVKEENGEEYKLSRRVRQGGGKIREALELFDAQLKGYFSRIESEVVHLALAISAKILHREAQVDPFLVAALGSTRDR